MLIMSGGFGRREIAATVPGMACAVNRNRRHGSDARHQKTCRGIGLQ
jgi:hypothetical protein